jgi:cobalt-zinc-cadmium efflux system outer membrane protein
MKLLFLAALGLGFTSCASAAVKLPGTASGGPSTPRRLSEAPSVQYATAASGPVPAVLNGAWDLGRLLAESERRNPTLAAERREIDVATAQVWEASLYPNPSLLVEYEDGRWLNSPPWQATHRVGVRVPLVVGGRVRAARVAAEAERDVAALRYTWRRREILSEVRVAYAELLGARRVLDAARASRDVARDADSSARARLEAQVAPEADVLKASVDLARAEADVAEAEHRVAAAGRSLIAVSAVSELDPDRLLGASPESYVVPAWANVAGDGPSRHPLVVIAQREQEAARLRVDEANAQRRADWALEVKGGVNEDGDGVVSFGLEIPLPIRDNGSAGIAVAEARRMVAASKVEGARNDVLRRLSTLYRAVVLSQERVRRYATDVLPPARTALEQTRFGHEKGKFTYLEVLDAQRTLSEATAAYATALSELYQAVAEFESYSGIELVPQSTESK